jgi:LacI family transcriptional regulator
MRPTVHDLAASAGVSLATVDRVLNRRAGVRDDTRRKVEEAISAIGYVRDVAAANLAKGRTYPFIFIVPASDNSFMQRLRAEILSAMARGSIERTRIDVIDVPPFDVSALHTALDKAEAERPSGIALVAIDDPLIRLKVDEIVQGGIPVVTLVSDLSQSQRVHFSGVDNMAAGRTAGSLMGRFLGGKGGHVGVLVGSMQVKDHRERLDGFRQVMGADFPALTVLPVVEGRDNATLVFDRIVSLSEDVPDLLGLYSLGAGNQGLIRALRAKGRAGSICVIAHELSDYSRKALEDGVFDAVLNQDPGHEVRSALRVLKATADGLDVIAGQEKIRIDIFLKDNLP